MDPITRTLDTIHAELAGDGGGRLADYIPELAAADPDRFGLALVSMGGTVYQAGDAEPFTIQSVSKPFVHALALADNGLDAVLARVSAEPSGEPFNAVSIDPGTGRPANPMINAGAILTTSLVASSGPGRRWARIHAALSAFAGRELEVDEATFASEQATGFAAAELVLAELLALPETGARLLLLDLALVWRMRPVAAGLLSAAVADLAGDGVRTAAAGPAADQVAGARGFARPADAIAWCEDTLLAEVQE